MEYTISGQELERLRKTCKLRLTISVILAVAVYLAALGGAGALMAASVKKLEVICWEDLGCEAVRRLEVEDMPLTVILDPHGGDLYQSGPAAYLASLEEK